MRSAAVSENTERHFRAGPFLAAIVATVLFLWLLGTVADILLLLFVASLLALFLNAVTDALCKRTRLPRRLAYMIALFGSLGAIFTLGALLVPPVVEQTRQLIGVLPDYIKAWQSWLMRVTERYPAMRDALPAPSEIVSQIVQQLEGTIGGVLPKVVSLGHVLVSMVSVLVMGIYISLYPNLYREWLIALFPPVHRDLVRDVLGDIGNTLRAWITAQLLAMTILGSLTAIGLYILKVPYWLTFGVFTGAVVIIPFFGTLIGTLLPALFVLGGTGYAGFSPGGHFILVILLGVLLHIIEGNFVVPLITSKRLEIPPVLSMLAVLIVGRLLGLGGIIVSVPLLAVTLVIVRRVLIHRVYEGQNFRRAGRDRVMILRVPLPDHTAIVPQKPIDVLRSVTVPAAIANA
ncbi:MAG: AI-2E family transporter [Acidobacteriota bacterium]